MLSGNSNSNIAVVSSRKPPTCTRCRNHGIFNVQLKGHRNLCQYKRCTCKHCILILQRRLVVIKPDRDQEESRGKTLKRKRSSNKLEVTENNVGEALIKPKMEGSLPSTLTQTKGHPESAILNLTAFNEGVVSKVKHGSPNLPKEQPRLLVADCANLARPSHPYYGFLHSSPRMQSFNPGALPNITVGSPRLMLPFPDQPNMYLNFPVTYPQGFAINPTPLNMAIQRSMEPH